MPVDYNDPIDILSRTMWAEARNQGYAGMYAVGCVVRNRSLNPRWWGHSIISVCLEPFQFSSWNAGDPNRAQLLAVTSADPQFSKARTIASAIIGGGLDTTDNADSYYARDIPPPSWCARATFTVQIGAHRFYRVELPAPNTATPAQPYGDPLAPCIAATTADLNAAELNRITGANP